MPVGAWIAEDGTRLGALVAVQQGVLEVARPDKVRALFKAASGKREGMAAWSLLFYALWHQANILGQPTDGDLFDTLVSK